MELTAEQQAIINSTGNIKINAVAGSGKTTTIIEYAAARPKASTILYLAFNKSVKLEAVKRFAVRGLTNVEVETAHSLAYRHIVFTNGYRVKAQGYKTNEIAELLNLQGNGEKHAEYIVANHINKFIAYFCNSAKQKVQELNYLDVVTDSKAKKFVTAFYPYIESQTRLLLSKMDKGEIEITHDFYLKKFQLSYPQLQYEYILFDEGQDASPAMLDIFLNQKATKVIVGDLHQQIYGWRHAVNALQSADFATFRLSTSFRFSQAIANLAVDVLSWKKYIDSDQSITITGKGTHTATATKAVLARTNLGLLLKAIEYITEKKGIQHIYFEGNINSYTYADEGASLYDVLNLYNGKHQLVKDKLVMAMKDIAELEDYIEQTEEVQLGMMVEIVKEYGNEIPGIIKSLKDKHVSNEDKEKAEMVFSTVHRCKGMEYDAVQLVNDFITEERLKKVKEEKETDIAKLNEEINLLYVAITRTKNSLHIPEPLLPKDFPASPHIHLIKTERKEDTMAKPSGKQPSFTKQLAKTKAAAARKQTPATARKEHKAAFNTWTDELDQELTELYCRGESIEQMAAHVGRAAGAIAIRIKKLDLGELYGYRDNNY